MSSIDFTYQILKLSTDFYDTYPHEKYPEILLKRERSYNCLLLESHYGYFICIPYRSEINHPYAFKFKGTKRSKRHSSGLDYTKIIIIKETRYFDNSPAIIDKDEFLKTERFIKRIRNEALNYIETYINHIQNTAPVDVAEYKRKYSKSTLPYFHKELGID